MSIGDSAQLSCLATHSEYIQGNNRRAANFNLELQSRTECGLATAGRILREGPNRLATVHPFEGNLLSPGVDSSRLNGRE